MVTPLHFGQGHMSVGDSAEESISIHALGRERLLVLSCGLPSHPLQTRVFVRWKTIESSSFSFIHTSCQMCFEQKPDRRPPEITGRRVSAVHQGGVGAPKKLATFRVYNAVVAFVERSVWRTRNGAASNSRSAREFLRPMLAKIAATNISFPEFWKVSKTNLPNRDRSGNGWLMSSGIETFWPPIVTSLT